MRAAKGVAGFATLRSKHFAYLLTIPNPPPTRAVGFHTRARLASQPLFARKQHITSYEYAIYFSRAGAFVPELLILVWGTGGFGDLQGRVPAFSALAAESGHNPSKKGSTATFEGFSFSRCASGEATVLVPWLCQAGRALRWYLGMRWCYIYTTPHKIGR